MVLTDSSLVQKRKQNNEVSCLWEFYLIKNKNLHPLEKKEQKITYLVITDDIRLFPGKVSIVNFHTFHVL